MQSQAVPVSPVIQGGQSLRLKPVCGTSLSLHGNIHTHTHTHTHTQRHQMSIKDTGIMQTLKILKILHDARSGKRTVTHGQYQN